MAAVARLSSYFYRNLKYSSVINKNLLKNQCCSAKLVSCSCNITYHRFNSAVTPFSYSAPEKRYYSSSGQPSPEEVESRSDGNKEKIVEGESEKHEFKAETRMLLEIVAKSLYSDKEVFIRELISNASDALEKLRYYSLTEGEGAQLGSPLEVRITTDKQNRTITIQDSGIGMTHEELTSNLGTIARSGSKALTGIKSLVLAGNRLSHLESSSMPITLTQLHLGHNRLTDLNGTLRGLSGLEWLFLNNNNLTSLEDQFPDVVPNNKIYSINISYNRLQHLPKKLRGLQILDSLFSENNRITSLRGALAKSKKLTLVDLTHNEISVLEEDDFAEAERLEELFLGHNLITSLNSSLLPLRSLKQLNLTHNQLLEFSLQDIKGLRQLRIVDLSHNKIAKLGGRMENLVEMETRVIDLRLEYNELESLSGSLMGLGGLQRLNLSHNRINTISPDDLIGLDDLNMLDISHNRLTTLEETSRTFLPSLENLIASHNALTALERDFHGLPVLCWADLSHNQIATISRELAEKTQCRVHGVNSTLRIYLQGNPVLCNEKITDTITAMESKNNTKIHGTSDCQPQMNISTTYLEPEVIPAQLQFTESQSQTT